MFGCASPYTPHSMLGRLWTWSAMGVLGRSEVNDELYNLSTTKKRQYHEVTPKMHTHTLTCTLFIKRDYNLNTKCAYSCVVQQPNVGFWWIQQVRAVSHRSIHTECVRAWLLLYTQSSICRHMFMYTRRVLCFDNVIFFTVAIFPRGESNRSLPGLGGNRRQQQRAIAHRARPTTYPKGVGWLGALCFLIHHLSIYFLFMRENWCGGSLLWENWYSFYMRCLINVQMQEVDQVYILIVWLRICPHIKEQQSHSLNTH